MPVDLILSSIMAIARALFIATLLMLTSPAWFHAISRFTKEKCSAKALSVTYVAFMSCIAAGYLVMELVFRLRMRLGNPIRTLDVVIGITLLHLALYAMIGVGFMIKFHVYRRRIEVALILIASVVPAVNGCFRIAKNVFQDQTYMLIQGIEGLIYILILFVKASMSVQWEASQVQTQMTEIPDEERVTKTGNDKNTAFLPWNVHSSQTLAPPKSSVTSYCLHKAGDCEKNCGDVSTPTSSNLDPFEYDYATSVSMRKSLSKKEPIPIEDTSDVSLDAPIDIKGTNIPMAVYITQVEPGEDYK
ncbi:hypothetical protein E3P99_02794 [Wallemia hederae]|uniref:Uncharacterized protein n=1 Tax=Wallemia hederae TaxID=1540922 RepID=A0A4T0FI21_9BASI|nr:hypothetical protein E3P99_02794 [Wallemia hederae]